MKRHKTKTVQFTIISIISILLIIVVTLFIGKDYFLFKKYTHDEAGFSIKYPSDWTVEEDQNGVPVIFLSPLENDLDIFRENVNIVVQDLGSQNMNLKKYTTLAIKQMKAVFKHNLTILESGSTRFSGLPAYKFIYLGSSGDGDPDIKNIHIWTLDGRKAYQFTYSALESKHEKYLFKINQMIRSFRIK